MQASFVLGLLFVLLPATIENCLQCTGTQESCSASLKTCNVTTEGACIFTLETVSLGGKDNVTVYAGCVQNKTTCLVNPFSLTIGTDKQVRANSMCCEMEKCNQNITMTVPSNSTVKTGLQCTACDASNADECKNNPKVFCTGSEDHCIDFAGTAITDSFKGNTNVTNTTLILKGCATWSVCRWKVNENFYYSQKMYKLTKANCIKATSKGSTAAIHPLAFFSTLAGLLLVKQLS